MHSLQKVLILSGTYGEGHQQAALAIQEALQRMDTSIEVKVIDYLQMVHPVLNSVTRYCFIQSIRYAPSLYGFFYHRTRNLKSSSKIQTYLNQLGIHELEDFIKTYNPDMVISTFPTPAGVMSVLKARGITHVPTATVITDHAIHSQWIHPYTDMYFVGSEYVRRELTMRGVSEDKIFVTGIPIRSRFTASMNRAEWIQKFELNPNLPTVFVMGGSIGVLSDITTICEELFTYSLPMQVLVVCGRNEKLHSYLQERTKYASNLVKVFGFIHEVNELMAVSDIIITKAGGLTISESLAMELPMLLYRPIPGQEQQNANFLVHTNVAVLAKTKKEVFENLNTLLQLESINRLQTMRDNTKQIKKPFAANHIADRILQRFVLTPKMKDLTYHLYQWNEWNVK